MFSIPSGNYRIYQRIYDTAGTFTWFKPANLIGVEYLLIGGGGGGNVYDADTSQISAGSTTFLSATASGGGNSSGANGGTPGTGGSASGGIINYTGSPGTSSTTLANADSSNEVFSPTKAAAGLVFNYPRHTFGFGGISDATSDANGAGGGGAGGCLGWYNATDLSSTQTIIVGDGGTATPVGPHTPSKGDSGLALIREYVQI